MSHESSVEELLHTVRPAMQADGGDVELISVEDGTVSVRLKGMCLLCPSASLTLKNGIEQTLRNHLCWVKSVVRVP